jgi:hypothetical protein
MLNGTASRVLFGDPALVLTPPFVAPPFDVTLQQESLDVCRVVAVLNNPNLKSTFTDTYYSDLSAVPNLFNDRALITCRLPNGWDIVRSVDVTRVAVKTKPLKWRLVGFGVEHDGTNHLLHVQVDLPTDGYMQSAFRVSGATLELRVLR